MKQAVPLFNDEFIGEPPTKRVFSFLQSHREQGVPVAGIYCSYAPIELLHAMNIKPALLCAFANSTVEKAEEVLPANLCPLIKSSYGFIQSDTCPFFGISEAVIGETTCDGKKKMFELIAEERPLWVMDLPQLPDHKEAKDNWTVMIRKLQTFLEKTFDRKADDGAIEAALKDMNKKCEAVNKIFSYAAMEPPVISWKEIYDIVFLAMPATYEELEPQLTDIAEKLEQRCRDGYSYVSPGTPRVMVTGCPVGGDAAKIFKIIEEAGAVVVALDSCTGMKAFAARAREDTADPVAALSEKYLGIPCSCMTPNDNRLEAMDGIIERFKPDVVIDFILHACHSYNIESHKVGNYVKKKHGLPFLKIISDYSDADTGQIKTRVEAILDTVRRPN